MRPTATTLKIAALATAILLTAAACGNDDEPVTAVGDQPTSQPSDASQADEPSEPEPSEPALVRAEGNVIGSANIGGEVVDPQPTRIDDIAILESYPEQIMVNFTAGDEPCLAADARAIATETQVIVTLDVGITTDAMARSCLAGQFPQSIIIALDEGLDGREVIATDVAELDVGPGITEPEPQPFTSAIIGLSEQNAQEAVANEGLVWRVVARDGEDFAVTQDYLEDRINVSIVDGVVVEATVG